MRYAYVVNIFISGKYYVRGVGVYVRDSSVILCFVVVQGLWRDDVNNGASIDKGLQVQ